MKVTGGSKRESVAQTDVDAASDKSGSQFPDKMQYQKLGSRTNKIRGFRAGEVRSEKSSRKENNSQETGRKENSQCGKDSS